MKRWKAELALVFITLIWGGTFTFTKIALLDSQPFFYIFLRFFTAFIVCLILWMKFLSSMNLKIIYHGGILGLLLVGGFALQTYGLNLTTVTKSAFITGTTMVFTPFAYMIIARKKIKTAHIAGVIVSFLGLWLFTNPKFDNINLGDVLTLLSTIFWAFYITLLDNFTKDVTESTVFKLLSLVQVGVAAFGSFIFFLIFESGHFGLTVSNLLVISLIYNGIIASVLTTIIHTSTQKYTTPVKASLIFALEPVFASFIAFLVLYEFLIFREFSGAFILFAGVLVSEYGSIFRELKGLWRRGGYLK